MRASPSDSYTALRRCARRLGQTAAAGNALALDEQLLDCGERW
jgi:hypothetical protein